MCTNKYPTAQQASGTQLDGAGEFHPGLCDRLPASTVLDQGALAEQGGLFLSLSLSEKEEHAKAERLEVRGGRPVAGLVCHCWGGESSFSQSSRLGRPGKTATLGRQKTDMGRPPSAWQVGVCACSHPSPGL